MEILLFPISLLLSFFILYIISKNDFLFLRKNITLHNMFDTMVLSLMGFFITARLLYVFGGLHAELFSLIATFHVLRYPGMLYIGGLIGFGIILLLRFYKRKILLHIIDVYSLSLYPLFLFALFNSPWQGNFLYFNLFVFLLSLLFFIFALYSQRNVTLKDGSITLLFVCLVSVFTIVNEFAEGSRFVFMFSIPQILSIIIFVLSAIFLLVHESFIAVKKR